MLQKAPIADRCPKDPGAGGLPEISVEGGRGQSFQKNRFSIKEINDWLDHAKQQIREEIENLPVVQEFQNTAAAFEARVYAIRDQIANKLGEKCVKKTVVRLGHRVSRGRKNQSSTCSSSNRLPHGSAKNASLRPMAATSNGSAVIVTSRARNWATVSSTDGTVKQKW